MTSPTATAGTAIDRSKITLLLSRALEEMRLSMVDRILDKDSSFAMEDVQINGRSIPFAMACVQLGYAHGVAVAAKAGLQVNEPMASSLADAHTHITLLEAAVITGSSSMVATLVQMKASPNVPRRGAGGEALHPTDAPPLITRAFKDALQTHAWDASRDTMKAPPANLSSFAIPLILMDAGAELSGARFKDSGADTPAAIICRQKWDGCEVSMARMLSLISEKGADLNQKSPRCGLTPIQITIGTKNVAGVIALIGLGAQTADPQGNDIIDRCAKAGFGEEVTTIQAAIMRRVAKEAAHKAAIEASAVAAPAAASGSDDQPFDRRRIPRL